MNALNSIACYRPHFAAVLHMIFFSEQSHG